MAAWVLVYKGRKYCRGAPIGPILLHAAISWHKARSLRVVSRKGVVGKKQRHGNLPCARAHTNVICIDHAVRCILQMEWTLKGPVGVNGATEGDVQAVAATAVVAAATKG